MGEGRNRKTARTRSALVDAYNHLVLHRRQRHIKVGDIIAQARVGRSTFYDHYRSADALFLVALSRPFAILADAAAGAGGEARLERLLRHFWENRQRARDMLTGRRGEQVTRLLTDLVEDRLPDSAVLSLPRRLAAAQLAGAILAPVQAWLHAAAPCAPVQLAAALCRAGVTLRAGLEPAA